MFSTLGIAITTLLRLLISSTRLSCSALAFLLKFSFSCSIFESTGTCSVTFLGDCDFHTSTAAYSTRFGVISFIASSPFLISFIELRSSTVPFSQVAIINLWVPSTIGILESGLTILSLGNSIERSLTYGIAFSSVATSINVLRHLFLQK